MRDLRQRLSERGVGHDQVVQYYFPSFPNQPESIVNVIYIVISTDVLLTANPAITVSMLVPTGKQTGRMKSVNGTGSDKKIKAISASNLSEPVFQLE